MKEFDASYYASPIVHSHKYDDLERAMVDLFIGLVNDNEIDDLNNLNNYGIPWQGGRSVLENFSKLHGLAVVKFDDVSLSEIIMSIILSNWQALSSERGLDFLQFILNLLFPGGNNIVRLWHSNRLADSYPTAVTPLKKKDSFLTSRIRIELNFETDITNLSEIIPILEKLVPWNIVPEIAITADISNLVVGMAIAASDPVHVADFSPY